MQPSHTLQPTKAQWRAHMSHDRIAEQWANIGGKLRHRWRKLTADDVAYPCGSAEYLARVLQDRYGIDNRTALLQVYEFECDL